MKSTELLEAQGDVLSWEEIQIVTGTSDGSTEEAAREEAALNRFVLTESQVLSPRFGGTLATVLRSRWPP